ncbi:MAG: putative selenate reductase subunit YgfK [Candidatus Marinimicrobia bacterium]|nr:putative selenate reductase subunit YgfK [Candidatus Neomarinimicrobiota bacterium]
MNKDFSPISIKQLLKQILNSYKKNDSIFGIYDNLFFTPKKDDVFKTEIFNQKLETPIGVAAGPHTQMAQNIITAWISGARYIELKTVQTLDEIDVSKPCIDIQDEGYNCEWSQELTIKESFFEYLKAWIIIHILRDVFGWEKELGTIFNMSIGYDLAGIKKENVQWFLNKMTDCNEEKNELINEIKDIYPKITEIEIPNQISNNVTLSTMHGCPPDEIESIGKYLIEERKLHTFIKLNPTLLGKEKVREILNKKLGYETTVPDVAFEHDIDYESAVKVILSLQKSAKNNSVFFGVKLTNTLEATNHKNVFDAESMYMSGKALHPISINVARKLRADKRIKYLQISFCGGVDVFNIAETIACNLHPITVCSDLLKPGGYSRMLQYLQEITKVFNNYNAKNIQEYIQNRGEENDLISASNINLNKYADIVVNEKYYNSKEQTIKTDKVLNKFDCISAPCVGTCPTHQDIPNYMNWTANEKFGNALATILETNPFPNVTGMVCDHLCQTKCTRINYDNSLQIRGIKRFVAENSEDKNIDFAEYSNNKKVAIIGAGPSGLTCAYYLKIAGFEVDVYETKGFVGGMLADAIPLFRLSESALLKDIENIKKLGVNIITSQKIDSDLFKEIRKKTDFVYLATGAQNSKRVAIKGDIVENGMLDALEFLSDIRQNKNVKLGEKVIILGGGNTAIDTARTAKRFIENDGTVTIVYRRTRDEMPADQDEIQEALDEGIEIIELASPSEIISKDEKVVKLVCKKMKLGDVDSSGRRKPIEIENSDFEISADTIIPAFGQSLAIDFVDNQLLEVVDSHTYETKMENVFIGGDAFRGASSIIKAIADGRIIAENITSRTLAKTLSRKDAKNVFYQDTKLQMKEKNTKREKLTHKQLQEMRAKRKFGIEPKEIPISERDKNSIVEIGMTKEEAIDEASRCLLCDEVCDVCVSVCPNRANFSYEVEPFQTPIQKAINNNGKVKIVDDGVFKIEQKYQVLNIDNYCNECGNCETFCPTSGKPYKDKPKVYLDRKSFDEGEFGYFLDTDILYFKSEKEIFTLREESNFYNFQSEIFSAKLDIKDFSIIKIDFKNESINEISTKIAVEMKIIMNAIRELY